ncbi:hypothetical protein C8R47DRAFT_1145921 [Mycena vitilis]|nr:hypothetical protein C8R47DRAFT_1145921 [Mycena vitilis]
MDASVARVVLTSETAAVSSVFRSAKLKVEKCDAAPLREWIATRAPVEDARIREETVSVVPHAPIRAAPAAVKHPPRDLVTSTSTVIADPHSVLAPQELATESRAPPTIRAVLSATDSAPPERSSGVRESGGHAGAGIGLRSTDRELAIQGDRIVSDLAPVAAAPAAVKDPPCAIGIGGLAGISNLPAKLIEITDNSEALTSRTSIANTTVDEDHASHTLGFSIPSSRKFLAPALANAIAVELGGLPAVLDAVDQRPVTIYAEKAHTMKETERANGAASPLLHRALPKLPAVKSIRLHVYGTGKDASAECTPLPSSPLCALQLSAPGRVVGVDDLGLDQLAVNLCAKALRQCQQIVAAATRETRTLRIRAPAIRPATCREFPSSTSPAPAPPFEGGPVELGGLEIFDERKDKNTTRDVRTLSLGASVNANAPSPPVLVTDKAKVFALVSVIVRPRDATYLTYIRRGELAPYLAWEREGIGTTPWIC